MLCEIVCLCDNGVGEPGQGGDAGQAGGGAANAVAAPPWEFLWDLLAGPGWRRAPSAAAAAAQSVAHARDPRAAARGPNAQSGPARHLQTESKVVLGGGPAGLYPRAPSMIRGKFPGY